MNSLEQIPVGILDQIGRALKTLAVARDGILRQRELGERFGSPGRYEFEYRMGPNYPRVELAREILSQIEERLVDKGIQPDDVYAEMGGRAVVPDWSDEALEWLAK